MKDGIHWVAGTADILWLLLQVTDLKKKIAVTAEDPSLYLWNKKDNKNRIFAMQFAFNFISSVIIVLHIDFQ